MENKNYPLRNTNTVGFFSQLSIFRFDESTYPTENAHEQYFPNHQEWKIRPIPWEKNYTFGFFNFPFSDLTNPPIQQKMHM